MEGNVKKLKVVIILLIPLLFTGCLDFFQSISIRDGEVDISIRYTIQSALFEMINEFSDEKIDLNEILHEADSIIPVYEDLSFEVASIDTTFHKGFEIRMVGNMDSIKASDEEKYFLPLKTDSYYSILIPSLQVDREIDEMAAALLSGSMFTLLIDLSGDLKDIKDARMVHDGNTILLNDEDSEILVNVYGSSMQIEIPMLILFFAPEDFYVELY